MKRISVPQTWGALAAKGAVAFALGLGLMVSPASADVKFTIDMNYDVTGTGQYGQYMNDFTETFATIEGILQTWSGPRAIESLYDGFTIDVEFTGLDGAGGTIAQAGVTSQLDWGGPTSAKGSGRGAVATAGSMQVDTDDIAFYASTGQLRDVIMHEAFHALGFAPLWDEFGYRDASGLGYIGKHGVEQYRKATGDSFALFVPLEASGGGGTMGGHWSSDDPYFRDDSRDRNEIMVGFIAPPGVEAFISPVTLGQFRDLGYGVPGLDGRIPDDGWPTGGGTKPSNPSDDDDGGVTDPGFPGAGGGDDPTGPDGPNGGGGGDWPRSGDGGWVDWGGSGRGFSAVPEPSSGFVIGAMAVLGALGVRRRK